MLNLISEELFTTKVERFLRKKGYKAVDVFGRELSIKELESVHDFCILKGKPSKTKSGIDQPEFLATINLSGELEYWDRTKKSEVFDLAEEICKTFGVHVSITKASKSQQPKSSRKLTALD